MSNSTSNVPDDLAATDARALIEHIPLPVLVRHASGRVTFANAAARATLCIDEATELERLTLTRLVGDDRARDDGAPTSFLLTHEHEPRTRFAATLLSLGEDREALFLVPNVTSIAAPRRSAADLGGRRRYLTTRALAADIVRRIRRHAATRATLPVRAQHRLTRDLEGTRLVHADPVGIAQLVLSGLLLLAESDSPCTGVQFSLVGLQFRIVVEGQASRSDGIFPDLQRQTALLRSIRPILSEHDATFALERDKRGTRRIVVTLPVAG